MSQRGRLPQGAQHIRFARKQALILKIAVFSLALLLGSTLVVVAQNSPDTKTVVLSADGAVRRVATTAGTVRALLQQEKIVVTGLDRCEPSGDTPLVNNLVIAVTRVTCERFTRRTEIPSDTETRLDSRLYTSQTFEVQRGRTGIVKEKVVVWKRDGAVSAQWVEERKVVRRVRPTIILKGTQPESSRSGFMVRRILTVSATAYDPGPGSCGPHSDGYTATGMKAGKGVIAVDPRVIPLGTRVFVDGYGPAIAADTGSAIKGNRIDVCFPTRSEALRWGRRRVQVMILQ